MADTKEIEAFFAETGAQRYGCKVCLSCDPDTLEQVRWAKENNYTNTQVLDFLKEKRGIVLTGSNMKSHAAHLDRG